MKKKGFTLIELLAVIVILAVIGRSGKIANAIRTLVQASAYINGNKHVKINIDSI